MLSADAGALALGGVLVAAPLLAGAALGRALRALQPPLGPRYVGVAPSAAAAILALSVPAAEAMPTVGTWDVLLTGLLLALGVLATARPTARGAPLLRARAARLAVVIALTLGALEVLSRLLLPRPPWFPPPREARLMVSLSDRDLPCHAMFPDQTGFIEERAIAAEGKPVKVLHVGDSMVQGTGVETDEAFPALLGKLSPGVGHINAGASGAGPESHLLVAGRWVERMRVDLVVVYFFMGNDVHDLDRAYPCCGMGPLLDFRGSEPVARCDAPRWTFPLGVLLSASPAPYPLRVAAGYSRFAAHLTGAITKVDGLILSAHLFGAPGTEATPAAMEARFAEVDQVMRALHTKFEQEKTPLLLVVLPYRETLERASGLSPSAPDVWGTLENGQEARLRVVASARRAGVDVVDAWDPLRDAIARDGAPRWFADRYPGDVHFSREGHALFARWMAAELGKRGIGIGSAKRSGPGGEGAPPRP